MLDEAHKYLGTAIGSRLTRTIASLIRQQRHLGLRIIISTQEPTIIPATILDLSSYIICHRFSAPSWCTHLKRHVSLLDGGEAQVISWMDEVMRLHTGEALVFSPNSVAVKIDTSPEDRDAVARLGAGCLKILTRPRITADGGFSIMAVKSETFPPPNSSSTGERLVPSLVVETRNDQVSCTTVHPRSQTPSNIPDLPSWSTAQPDHNFPRASQSSSDQISRTTVHPRSRTPPNIPDLPSSSPAQPDHDVPRTPQSSSDQISRTTVHPRSPTSPKIPDPPSSSQAQPNHIVSRTSQSSSARVTTSSIDHRFRDLIQILEKSRSAGVRKLRSSDLAAKLKQARPSIFAETGFTTWIRYSTQAVLLGLIKVEDKEFIRLASEMELRSFQAATSGA